MDLVFTPTEGAKLTDGYGHVIDDINFLAENLYNYISFDQAAISINPNWTRHFIHKELVQGRIFLSEILVLYDLDQFDESVSEGKKFFITKDEVERIREYVNARPKRKTFRCHACGRQLRYCDKQPCEVKARIYLADKDKQSIEQVQEFFERFLSRSDKGRKRITEFNRKGKQIKPDDSEESVDE